MVAAAREREIVVTGLGLATSLGFGVAENWPRLLAGESAIVSHDPGRFLPPLALPTRLGAAVERKALGERVREAVPRGVWNTSAEVCHLWLLAALEALESGGLQPEAEAAPERLGIFVGNGGGPVHFIEQEYANIYTAEKPSRRDVSRMGVPKYMASSLAAQLSLLTGFRGSALTLNAACASGAFALLAALDALRLGRLDGALAGGVELSLGGTVLKGFANLAALSLEDHLGPEASRPFDAERSGFVLGEGAACLLLETAGRARARGATPLAVLRGGATSSEAHSLLSQQADGLEIVRCLELALADAALPAERVAHVYTHGTGTAFNDRCEALALNRVFPHRPPISATKALLGHTIGAAAAIDAVLAVQTLRTGRPVPVRHVSRPDPECDLHLAAADTRIETEHVGGNATGGPPPAVAVDAFAFGGHNAGMLFTLPETSTTGGAPARP